MKFNTTTNKRTNTEGFGMILRFFLLTGNRGGLPYCKAGIFCESRISKSMGKLSLRQSRPSQFILHQKMMTKHKKMDTTSYEAMTCISVIVCGKISFVKSRYYSAQGVCVCVCVFLASDYEWFTVIHEIPISSAQTMTSLPYPRTQ
jgi:hypothetical protein